MITSLDIGENPVMVYPFGQNCRKARHKGEVMGPQCQQGGGEAVLAKLSSLWHLDGKNQQRYGDSEDAVAERLNSHCFTLCKCLCHLFPLLLIFFSPFISRRSCAGIIRKILCNFC